MSPDPRLSELLEKLIENWRRAESVERAEALHADQRGRELFEQSADTYQICADELAAVLLGGTPRSEVEEEKEDAARVAPLTAGADRQDLPQPAPAVAVTAAAKEIVDGLKKWLTHEPGCGALVPPYSYCSCGLQYGFDSVLQAFDILAGYPPAESTAEQRAGAVTAAEPLRANANMDGGSIVLTGDARAWRGVFDSAWQTIARQGKEIAGLQKQLAKERRAASGGIASSPTPSLVDLYLKRELETYLDQIEITSENIGEARRSLFVPWDSAWNGIVRDETAQRENVGPAAPVRPVQEKE